MSGGGETRGGAALEVRSLTKRYGGLEAVQDLDLAVAYGERRGIIGPNGAGKTTLFRLLSGETPPTAGRILLLGEDVTGTSAHRRARKGIGRTYQITSVFPALSVRDNLRLAVLRSLGLAYLPWWGARRDEVHERVETTLERSDLAAVADATAATLSHGEQRQVELAIALATEPLLLLLDEPAAGLSATERARMSEIIGGLSRDVTLCLIEHDMDFALGLSDSVTCLHRGQEIATAAPDEIREDERVQSVYLGAGA